VYALFAAGALLLSHTLQAAPVSPSQTLTGGASSSWFIDNTGGTSNGLPSGGVCDTSPGLTIGDASAPFGGDAFDRAGIIWINNAIFVAPAVVDLTGQTLTAGPVAMAGLNVTQQYHATPSTATLRNLVTLQNPTGGPITVTLTLTNNWGSDSGTIIRGTSSGDLVFDLTDRWEVTSDGSDSDPVNTSVYFGPGAPAVTPSSVAPTVFDCANTPGGLVNFTVTVPAGATRYLMFFHRLTDTTPNALADAPSFNTNPPAGSELLDGLTDLANIVNWAFAATPTPTPTPPMPPPSGPTAIPGGGACAPLGAPVVTNAALSARPLGYFLSGDNFVLTLYLGPVGGLVDLYIVVQLPSGQQLILNNLEQFLPFPATSTPFMSNTLGPVAMTSVFTNLFNAPLSAIPPGSYLAYLLMVPAGINPASFSLATSPYYLWCFTKTF
jgi:hypothetical protein